MKIYQKPSLTEYPPLGKIVAQGFPEAVFANKVSSLYRLDKLTY